MSDKQKAWLVRRAKALAITNPDKLTIDELKQQIKDRTGVAPADPKDVKPAVATGGETKPKEGEVLPPLRKGDANMGVVINVPSPNVNIDARVAPQWFEVIGVVYDKLLHIGLGLAIGVAAKSYALF